MNKQAKTQTAQYSMLDNTTRLGLRRTSLSLGSGHKRHKNRQKQFKFHQASFKTAVQWKY